MARTVPRRTASTLLLGLLLSVALVVAGPGAPAANAWVTVPAPIIAAPVSTVGAPAVIAGIAVGGFVCLAIDSCRSWVGSLVDGRSGSGFSSADNLDGALTGDTLSWNTTPTGYTVVADGATWSANWNPTPNGSPGGQVRADVTCGPTLAEATTIPAYQPVTNIYPGNPAATFGVTDVCNGAWKVFEVRLYLFGANFCSVCGGDIVWRSGEGQAAVESAERVGQVEVTCRAPNGDLTTIVGDTTPYTQGGPVDWQVPSCENLPGPPGTPTGTVNVTYGQCSGGAGYYQNTIYTHSNNPFTCPFVVPAGMQAVRFDFLGSSLNRPADVKVDSGSYQTLDTSVSPAQWDHTEPEGSHTLFVKGTGGSQSGFHVTGVDVLYAPVAESVAGLTVEVVFRCGLVVGSLDECIKQQVDTATIIETYPDCLDGSCTLRVYHLGQPCTLGAAGCVDWTTKIDAAPGDYTCRWGPYTMPMHDCDPLATRYNTGTQPTATPSPSTGTGLDPYPQPSTGPQPTATGAPRPGEAGAPNASDTAGNECWPSGWGVFNPLEWVYRPVVCAFKWAFVPRASVWTATMGEGGALGDFKASPFGQWNYAAGDVIGAFAGIDDQAGGCDGPVLNGDVGGVDYSLAPMRACDPPMSTVAAVTRGLLTVIVGFGGAFLIMDPIFGALGLGVKPRWEQGELF